MSVDADYLLYLEELFSGLGRITTRAMFGGRGIYHDGIIIAIVADSRLFLKVDEVTKPEFAGAGCVPFTYQGAGKSVEMSYWTVPEAAMDSAEDMTRWARLAYAAALRKANAPKPARSSKPKSAQKPKPKRL